MKEHPIIFNGDMVRAIQSGHKTVTRRVIRKPERLEGLMLLGEEPDWCPYGGPGDRLWVRETFGSRGYWEQLEQTRTDNRGRSTLRFRWHYDDFYPDYDIEHITIVRDGDAHRAVQYDYKPPRKYRVPGSIPQDGWRSIPSIHMPRWASRITLEVLSVHVERVQEITETDTISEGVQDGGGHPDFWVGAFRDLWDSINDKRGFGWEVNPWVWVVEFKEAKP